MQKNKTSKIAVTGKGGVGKSTVVAALALLTAKLGKKVLAIDADPDANLASALGISLTEQKKIITIAQHKQLIEERTGAKIKQYGQIFKLNPEVNDIADKYAYHHQGIELIILGAVQSGGAGCACPENTLLRALIQNLVLQRDEILFLDMEPGTEHLGRATAQGVTSFIIVVEPGQRSLESFKRISRLAGEIGINTPYLIANKIKTAADQTWLENELGKEKIIGFIPYSEVLLRNDREGKSVIDNLDHNLLDQFTKILHNILSAQIYS